MAQGPPSHDGGLTDLRRPNPEYDMSDRYNPQAIESKWQERWEADGLYRTDLGNAGSKFYCLDFFPYPSGDGLSVGHCRNYIPTDVISRYKRMCGFNVLHPMGWDAFGLPAENEAILRGRNPSVTVPQYTSNFKRQLKLIGTSYDWDREINSSQPDYYRWTQWFFLLLYQRGLAYRATASANWCPSCATVLANEEVEAGNCWRCGSPITKRDLPQWFLRITDYADRLLEDLNRIDWPEPIIAMQKNWIGRSEGVEITFGLDIPSVDQKELRVFTTRPDTVFGVTFMVLAPEHPLVPLITTPDRRTEVEAYVEQARRQTEIERLSTEREKSGVFTGAYCHNLLSGEDVPIWIADYALLWYGTGAVMGVPAHDQRDFEFAERYGFPIRVVIAPADWDREPLDAAYVESGVMVNSAQFNGLPSEEGKHAVADYVESKGWGGRTASYRLRDWLISRQRYWGTPIPIVHCPACGEVPVPEEDLPVLLPPVEQYEPSGKGKSPLANLPELVHTTCTHSKGPAERETDTM
ncbi:MAG: leucine--tRNA ligase, partial [bacterium]